MIVRHKQFNFNQNSKLTTTNISYTIKHSVHWFDQLHQLLHRNSRQQFYPHRRKLPPKTKKH